MLELSEEQNGKLDALEAEVRTKVEEILDAEQLEQLTEMFKHGPPPPRNKRFGGPDGPRGGGRRPPRQRPDDE